MSAPAEELVAVALDVVKVIAADAGLAVRNPFIVADPLVVPGCAQDVVDIGLELPAPAAGQIGQFLRPFPGDDLLEENLLRFQRLDEAAGKEQQRAVAQPQPFSVWPGRLVHAARGDGDDDALIAGGLQRPHRPVRHAAVTAQEGPVEVDGDHLNGRHRGFPPSSRIRRPSASDWLPAPRR